MTEEIIVILHTSGGDVRTAFPYAQRDDAWRMFSGYCADGKSATITTKGE